MAKRSIALTAIVGCLLTAACGKGTVHNVGGSGSSGRSTPGANSTSASILRFGDDLARHLGREQPGNLAMSPASVATALTMTYAGARGETAAQMAKVLHVGTDAGRVAGAFGELRAALASRQGEGLTLENADALWGQRDTEFRRGFVDLVGRHFGAALQTVDYKKDAAAARVAINAWVSAHTHGRIPELFAEGTLNDRTRLVLADAVYLLAKWASPFRASETETALFHAPGHDVQARTMSQILTARYATVSGAQVVELPYVGGALVADVVLPEAGGLESLVGHLDERIPSILDGMRTTELQLRLPSFTLTSRFDLRPALAALGMPLAFADNADFSAMAKEPLAIQTVAHQVYLRLDEEGTEAAAATGVGMRAVGRLVFQGITMNVDRPFLLLIRDRPTGALLFLARVEDPTAAP